MERSKKLAEIQRLRQTLVVEQTSGKRCFILLLFMNQGLKTNISSLGYSGYMEFKTCEGSSRNIDCGSGKIIKLSDYWWGRTSKSYCRPNSLIVIDLTWSTNCKGGHGRIANNCHNRQSCKLEANNNWMNDDPCWGTPKYAWVKYRCYQNP